MFQSFLPESYILPTLNAAGQTLASLHERQVWIYIRSFTKKGEKMEGYDNPKNHFLTTSMYYIMLTVQIRLGVDACSLLELSLHACTGLASALVQIDRLMAFGNMTTNTKYPNDSSLEVDMHMLTSLLHVILKFKFIVES